MERAPLAMAAASPLQALICLVLLMFLQLADARIEVIAAGVSRTSTQSLSLALSKLGYKTLHAEGFHPKLRLDVEVPGIVDHVTKAAQQALSRDGFEALVPALDWLEALNITALVDIPWSQYGVELARRYPTAKVIVTVREKESWFRSYWEHFRWGAILPPPPFPSFPITQPFPLTVLYQPFAQYWRLVSQQLGCGAVTRFPPWPPTGLEKQSCLDGFDEHLENLKQGVPAESLLIYSIWEGWEPICRFLGRPVPEEAFPREDSYSSLHLKVGPWTFTACIYLCYAILLISGFTLLGCILHPRAPVKGLRDPDQKSKRA